MMQEALILLAVGMITVFIILTLLVVGGGLLISFINRFFPDEQSELGTSHIGDPSKDTETVAVLAAVVEKITNGKGKLSRFKKIS